MTCRSARWGRRSTCSICDSDGGIINDPVLTRMDENTFWFALASSDALLFARGLRNAYPNLNVTIREADVAPMQIQGPKSKDLMQALVGDEVLDIKYYFWKRFDLGGIPVVVTRTGWTSEVGYEIYLEDTSKGTELWDKVMAAGKPFNVRPTGPSDIRRIEGGIFNWGADMTYENNPYEMGLGRLVDDLSEDACISIAALKRIAGGSVERQINGVELDGDPFPALNNVKWSALDGDAVVGKVTSAIYSPRLERNIGYCWLPDRAVLDGLDGRRSIPSGGGGRRPSSRCRSSIRTSASRCRNVAASPLEFRRNTCVVLPCVGSPWARSVSWSPATLPLAVAPPVSAAVLTFSFSHGTETVTGTSGNDSISVTCTGGDLQAGGMDSGKSCGSVTHLVVKGGGGNDTMSIQAVTHAAFTAMLGCRMIGGAGSDSMQSSPLDDVLQGGADHDILRPQGGHDVMDGGAGYDELYASGGADQTITNTVYHGLGRAKLLSIETFSMTSDAGTDTLDSTGWTKTGSYPDMSGGAGNDTLLGGPVGERIHGDDGADVIHGGGGSDDLYPEAGAVPADDTVLGGPGHDTLEALMYAGGGISDTLARWEATTPSAPSRRSSRTPTSRSRDRSSSTPRRSTATSTSRAPRWATRSSAGRATTRSRRGRGADAFYGHGGTDTLSINITGAGAVNISAASATSTSDGADTIDKVERVFVYGDSSAQTYGSSAFPGTVSFQGGGGNDLVNGNGPKTTYALYQAATPVVVTDADITTGSDDIGMTNVGHVIVGADSSAAPMSMNASAYSGSVEFYGGNERRHVHRNRACRQAVGLLRQRHPEGSRRERHLVGRVGAGRLPRRARVRPVRQQVIRGRDLLRGQGSAAPDVAVGALAGIALGPAVSFGRPARRDARKGTR